MSTLVGAFLGAHRKGVAISGAAVVVVALGIGIPYEMGLIGGEYLPSPAAGVHRMPIPYDNPGAPAAEAPDLTFTRHDGTAVTISLYTWSHPGDGLPAFDAWVGTNPENQRVGPTVITVGQSAVLDGVRVTVVANWGGSKYRADAVDLRVADANA
jgi:hypothetical protein